MIGAWPVFIAMLLYLWQSGAYYMLGDRPMSLTFFAYALANVGFILDYAAKAGALAP